STCIKGPVAARAQNGHWKSAYSTIVTGASAAPLALPSYRIGPVEAAAGAFVPDGWPSLAAGDCTAGFAPVAGGLAAVGALPVLLSDAARSVSPAMISPPTPTSATSATTMIATGGMLLGGAG